MGYKFINTQEISTLLEDHAPFILVNVLPDNFFNEAHIPGSINIDGYKMDFISAAEDQLPDKERLIVLYDSGKNSNAASYAAQRMSDRGWKNLRVYKGGLEEWTDSGNKIEGTEFPNPERPPDKIYNLDIEKSYIHWSGRNINRVHIGTVRFLDGTISVASGTITKADLTVQVSSIRNLDLSPEDAFVLETHLKSVDFFNIEKYPTASIHIDKSKEISEIDSGIFNIECYGSLQIKDVTKDIVLHAQFSYEAESKHLKISSLINLDRTIWNVTYGSAKYFKMLGRHFVDDIITVDVHVTAL